MFTPHGKRAAAFTAPLTKACHPCTGAMHQHSPWLRRRHFDALAPTIRVLQALGPSSSMYGGDGPTVSSSPFFSRPTRPGGSSAKPTMPMHWLRTAQLQDANPRPRWPSLPFFYLLWSLTSSKPQCQPAFIPSSRPKWP